MTILERDHQSAHWKGCYEEHLGCANARLEEARSHAGRLAEAVQRLVQWQDGITPDEFGEYMQHARETLSDYQKWEESQP